MLKDTLLKKTIENCGLNESEWSISDDAIQSVIRYYSREAGVRGLEREINTLARKAVKEIEINKSDSVNVTSENISNYLGEKNSGMEKLKMTI